ncbi:50S ribosomal protein L29 [Nitrosomonas sp.]|uniref:50S ribosomal protein L29 n=1 Tax=Nitrosomonas sp. TaxID=42353 RepID=UPI001E0D39FE|nr:50S ribosomal protein L29 [Nitrosomonas sp.]MBX3616443.1 50S ribosomal protein L29 [Nitrosomonas sp.]
MNVNDLRLKKLHELNEELLLLLKVQFSLRMQHATQQLVNTKQIKKNRKDIARVKTVISQKNNYEQ